VIAFLAVYGWAEKNILNWQDLDMPYNYIAAFYYYVIGGVITGGVTIWDWLSLHTVTTYPNVNLSIAVVGVIFYVLVLFAITILLIRILWKFGLEANVLLYLFFSPAFLSGLWFVVLALYDWLFALS
jgi:hypothetical protein